MKEKSQVIKVLIYLSSEGSTEVLPQQPRAASCLAAVRPGSHTNSVAGRAGRACPPASLVSAPSSFLLCRIPTLSIEIQRRNVKTSGDSFPALY